MLHPAVSVGGEISVLGEDLLGADELLQLDQEALLTDVDMAFRASGAAAGAGAEADALVSAEAP